MKKLAFLVCATFVPMMMSAQSSIDAYNLSQPTMRGTARFMSMGGAFTALGGDLSSLHQNPAGIGVYRGSEFGITLDVNITSTKSSDIARPANEDKTYFNCNNFGYVGTMNFAPQSMLQTLSWGVSYNRVASFERNYSGGIGSLGSSLSNYVASYSLGVPPADLSFSDNYNPYNNPDVDWLAALSNTSLMIHPVYAQNPDTQQWEPTNEYSGLFQYGNHGEAATSGTAAFRSHEKGYVDEYSINFGGNVANVVMWGLGIGITDLNFTQESYWDESLDRAWVSNNTYNGEEIGTADVSLYNFKHTTGAGVNLKLGVIVKPIPELRLGFAVHTPTWYNLTTEYNADVIANYSTFRENVSEYTDLAHYDWRMKSPWKMMFGVAGVVGGRGILSLDYERTAYNNMNVSDDNGNEYRFITDQIKATYQASNTIRLGAEYRVTPQVSLRAGYSYTSQSANNAAFDQDIQVLSYDTNPAYTLTKSVNTFSCGVGYRYQGFYADFAFLHSNRQARYFAYTPYADANDGDFWTEAPSAKLSDNSNQLVFTFGYKF